MRLSIPILAGLMVIAMAAAAANAETKPVKGAVQGTGKVVKGVGQGTVQVGKGVVNGVGTVAKGTWNGARCIVTLGNKC